MMKCGEVWHPHLIATVTAVTYSFVVSCIIHLVFIIFVIITLQRFNCC